MKNSLPDPDLRTARQAAHERRTGLLRRALRGTILAFLLASVTSGSAQERPTANNAEATERLTTQQLLDLQRITRDTRIRLAPMLAEIVPDPAEDWLESSPAERLAERAEGAADQPAEASVWRSALEFENAAAERLRGALDRAARALAATERLEQAEDQIAAIIDARRAAPVPAEARALTRIEQDVAALERRRGQTALEREQKQQTLARLEELARTQSEALEHFRKERDTRNDIPTWGPLQNPELGDALDAYLRAEERRAEARVIAALLDTQSIGPRIDVLRVELQVLDAEGLSIGERLRQLNAEFEERSGEELRGLRTDLRRLLDRDPDAQQRFGTDIDTLLQRIDRIALTQARVRELQRNREEFARVEDDVVQTLASVRERIEISGVTEALGGLMLEEERRVRELLNKRFVLRGLERELTQSRLRDITLRDEIRALGTRVPSMVDDPTAAEIARLQRAIVEMQLQAEIQLTEQLLATEARLRNVVLQIDELAQLLRESLLWWPSHAPVGLEWSKRAPGALLQIVDADSWKEIQQALARVTTGAPLGTLLTLLAAGLLVFWGRHTPGHLARIAEKTAHRYSDRIGLTFQAMGWSLLRVLPVPLVLAATSYRLLNLPELGPGVEIIANVLLATAIWWLAGHLLLIFTRRNGVGTAHFEWNAAVVRRLRRHLIWYLPSMLGAILFLALAFGHPSDLVADVFGRAALLTGVALTTVFAWRMLAPFRDLAATPQGDRRRRFARGALVLGGVLLFGLALAGYLLTVGTLLGRVINSAVVVAVVYLGYSLAARALVLSETRLVMRRMREQRQKTAALDGAVATGEGAPIDIPEPHLSLENVNLQTRTLLRVSAGATLVLGLLWVWAEILPALTWLEGVTLWSRTIVVGETELLSRVSLQDFLLAILLGFLFTLAARNLPGLVEILLSRSTMMDAAGRYTVTTLLRYLLAVIAVISVFSLLGLRWSELQWMVAALTLGLGFGLQEVVANFVSGIIMLFERPVRVGDTITIGEYSGTVTRIRTRATTIVDFDNREIVVPNKNFITERLINWTLSDTMTRIVIPVGVSYDADVDEVMGTLRGIAENQPAVLKEPAPSVFFLKFADSALSFELRVYVGQLKDRMTTTSELHREIIRQFRSRGIEIAYPQMDLHIRDMAPMARAAAVDTPSGETGTAVEPRPAG